ncbi:MAG: hypothetical protein BJ554DRAFT_5587 [Olpidium bornovanus]|uniref:Uncharacterized protein n=1 Tax=Olpidium bornovanus TaxID=278681 RepID=A0A8H7ZYZ4_9FUNG|nr:MAG: hypothetical protein BJ554DRAFT_5587 [Olpidium bornovanus]
MVIRSATECSKVVKAKFRFLVLGICRSGSSTMVVCAESDCRGILSLPIPRPIASGVSCLLL